jgi:replicative DNA helicase
MATTTKPSNGHTSAVYETPDTFLPPYSEEAEAAVLGSLFIEPDRLSEVKLLPEMFYRGLYRQIFKAFKHLQENKMAIDVITVCDVLNDWDIADNVEVKVIDLCNSVPTSTNLHSYASIVRTDYNRRRAIALAGQIASAAYNGENTIDSIVSTTLDGIRKIGGDANDNEPISSYVAGSQILDVLGDRRVNQKTSMDAGLITGFRDLDQLLQGIEQGALVIEAGRPGMGKSLWEQAIRMNLIAKGKRVACFNLEMSTQQLTIRMLSTMTQIPYKQILHPFSLPEKKWQDVQRAIGKMSEYPMYLHSVPSLAIDQLEAMVHRLFAEHGYFSLITVDYLQLMRGRSTAKNRVEEIGQICRGLKQIAMELNTVVLAAAQINRGVEQRAIKKPMLSDLRESGDMEQDADIVIFLYRDEYYNPGTERAGICEIDVAKNRNGPVGEIDLFFSPEKMRFANLMRKEHAPIDL